METCNVVVSFESVDEILWCDHSNEISFTVLSHGTICWAGFEKLKIVSFLEFLFWSLLGVKGLKVKTWQSQVKITSYFVIRNKSWTYIL